MAFALLEPMVKAVMLEANVLSGMTKTRRATIAASTSSIAPRQVASGSGKNAKRTKD